MCFNGLKMTFKRVGITVSIGLLFLLLVSGTVMGGEVKSVAIVLPGSISDGSWNASGYQSLQELAAEGYKTAFTENCGLPDIEAALRGYADEGYDFIIGHGFEFGSAALVVAKEYPQNYFFVCGLAAVEIEIPENLQFINRLEFEGGFLCGVVAGLMTKTNIICDVAARETLSQLSNLAAYTKGAQLVNPDIKVLSIFTETYEDLEKGYEAASSMMSLGADVLFQTCDTTGLGAMQAAKEKGDVYIIGYTKDQREIAPDLVLTSHIINTEMFIKAAIDRVKEGTFGGGVWRAGIKDGIIDIGPFGSVVPKDVQEQVLLLRKAIIAGYLQAPEIYERLK